MGGGGNLTKKKYHNILSFWKMTYLLALFQGSSQIVLAVLVSRPYLATEGEGRL